jgi:hypothetical protein
VQRRWIGLFIRVTFPRIGGVVDFCRDGCWDELLGRFLESLPGLVSENTLSAVLGSDAQQEVVKLKSTIAELSNEVSCPLQR